MSFIRKQGKTKFLQLPVTTSTTFAAGDLVSTEAGLLRRAQAETAATKIIGVIVKAIATTDSDYATARSVAVEVPVEENVVWEADVTSGLVAADIGLYVDLTNAATINRGASAQDIARVVKVISTTKGEFILNIGTSGFGAGGAS